MPFVSVSPIRLSMSLRKARAVSGGRGAALPGGRPEETRVSGWSSGPEPGQGPAEAYSQLGSLDRLAEGQGQGQGQGGQ